MNYKSLCSVLIYILQCPNFSGIGFCIRFDKKESFKSALKCADGVCLPNCSWKLVPQDRNLIAAGFGSHSTFNDFGNHK